MFLAYRETPERRAILCGSALQNGFSFISPLFIFIPAGKLVV